MAWALAITWHAVTIGSFPLCGAAACVPTPVISALNWPTAAIRGPSFTPIVPTGISGLLWNPIIASTPSSTPSAINARAPWLLSSAGWKIKRTFPFKLASCSFNT